MLQYYTLLFNPTTYIKHDILHIKSTLFDSGPHNSSYSYIFSREDQVILSSGPKLLLNLHRNFSFLIFLYCL